MKSCGWVWRMELTWKLPGASGVEGTSNLPYGARLSRTEAVDENGGGETHKNIRKQTKKQLFERDAKMGHDFFYKENVF